MNLSFGKNNLARSMKSCVYPRIDGTGLAIIGITTLLAFLLVLQPASNDLAAQAADLRELTQQRDRTAQLHNMLDKVQGQLTRARKPASAVVATLQPAENLNDQLALLSDLAAASGVQVENLEPKGAALPTSAFTIFQIGVSGHASYKSCVAFLAALNAPALHTVVCSFNLSSPGNSGAVAMTLLLNWYAQPSVAAQPGHQ